LKNRFFENILNWTFLRQRKKASETTIPRRFRGFALVILISIPQNWVCWRLEPDKKSGRDMKVPYNPATGYRASTANKNTWTTLEAALEAKEKYNFTGTAPTSVNFRRGDNVKLRSNEPGDKNIVGAKILALRTERKIKQKDFLAQLQSLGLDISATSLSRLEGQYRLVQDKELIILAKALGVKVELLLFDN
jgi:hypothetical protein